MERPGARPADINRENSIFGRDRRRVARHPVHTPAYASLMGSSQSAALELCEVLNISENGMCIQLSAPMIFCADFRRQATGRGCPSFVGCQLYIPGE